VVTGETSPDDCEAAAAAWVVVSAAAVVLSTELLVSVFELTAALFPPPSFPDVVEVALPSLPPPVLAELGEALVLPPSSSAKVAVVRVREVARVSQAMATKAVV
jgi:hypothetical protein